MKCKIILEFDDEDLGEKWLNIDNLKSLLYGKTYVNEKALKINSFKYMGVI